MQDVPLNRTPDFYHYEERPLSSAVLVDDVAHIQWSDGVKLDAFSLWLFENQMGNVTIEDRTRESKIDPALFPDDEVLAAVCIAESGDLVADFVNGGRAVYHSGWLRHVADGGAKTEANLPTAVEWTTVDLTEPPTFDGPSVLADDAAMLAWLRTVATFGIARLENLGTTKADLGELGPRIGALRDTNFGPTWPVSVDIKPASTANTSLSLPPHTDLPTRETPPGFQLLHCLVNTCRGGFSTMADGYAVARDLAENDPDHYDALCTLNWVFFNRSPHHDHRWTGPIIDHGAPGMPLTLRAFHPVRGFPDMAIEDQPRAYAALRAFSRRAGSEQFQLRYPFKPGDLVMFDNRRILHGRAEIDIDGGVRELHGAYLDHDELYSRIRVLSRHQNQP